MKKSKDKIVSKSTNLTTKPEKHAKFVLFDEYLDMFTLRKKPVSIESIELLSQELIDWALNNPRALKISQFFKEKGISGSTIERWKERCFEFEQAHEYAKEIVGDRREVGAIDGDYDSGMIRTSMPIYDKDWRKETERVAKLKEVNSQMGDIKVIIDQCPNSDKVPDKKDE